MYTRFKEVWGQPDVILFQGDHVTHGLDTSGGYPDDHTKYEILKTTLKANAQLLSKHFPDTLVLPVVGNHDN